MNENDDNFNFELVSGLCVQTESEFNNRTELSLIILHGE